MIDELKSINLSQSVAVILCLNMKQDAVNEIDPNYGTPKEIAKNGLTTVFYKFRPVNSNKGKSKSTLYKLEEKVDFDIRNEEDINYFFRAKILKTSKAKDIFFLLGIMGLPLQYLPTPILVILRLTHNRVIFMK
jgi:hypothetical protein